MEHRAGTNRFLIEGKGSFERRSRTIFRGKCASPKIDGVDIRDKVKEWLPVEPVDVQSEIVLHLEQVFERLFSFFVICDKAITACTPLNVLPVFFLPM